MIDIIRTAIALATLGWILAGCTPATFEGGANYGSLSVKSSGASTGVNGLPDDSVDTPDDSDDPTACEPGDDCGGANENEEEDCGDDAKIVGPPPTVEEFIDIFIDSPATPLVKEYRCYISHGQGHGVELCMTGDKSALSALPKVEIKGDELCVNLNTLNTNTEAFAGAVMGRCE